MDNKVEIKTFSHKESAEMAEKLARIKYPNVT